MIRKNRIVRISIVLLTFMVLIGCTGKQESKVQQIQQESGKLTNLKILSTVNPDRRDEFPSMWFWTELEKKTGVRVDWDLVADAEWNTRISLLFASMDLPDVIKTGTSQLDVEEYGVSQKLLVPLDPYIKDHMPNYHSRLYLNNADKAIYSSDGKMYYVGGLIAQNVNHQGHDYINKTWLDRLGLAIPKTIEELTEVLRAFRDRDPNGNGRRDELPLIAGSLAFHTAGIYPHFAKFGVPMHQSGLPGAYASLTENEKVIFSTEYPGFRDAVEWLAMCYNEGLMDKESLTLTESNMIARVNTNVSGYFVYLRMLNTNLVPDIYNQFVPILPPASKYGVRVPRLYEVAKQDAIITVANKYIAQTCEWLDAQLETETMMVGWNGPIRAGAPIEPTMKINSQGKYEITYVPPNNGLASIVPILQAQFFAPGDYYFEIYEMPPHRVERYNASQDYLKAGVLEPYSYTILEQLIKPSNEDAIELSRLYVDIDKLMQESLAEFFRSGVTDARYNVFLSSLNNVGVSRYVSLLQKYYDAYAAGLK